MSALLRTPQANRWAQKHTVLLFHRNRAEEQFKPERFPTALQNPPIVRKEKGSKILASKSFALVRYSCLLENKNIHDHHVPWQRNKWKQKLWNKFIYQVGQDIWPQQINICLPLSSCHDNVVDGNCACSINTQIYISRRTSQHFGTDGASNSCAGLHNNTLNTKENYNILLLKKQHRNMPAMKKSAVMLPGRNRDVILKKKYGENVTKKVNIYAACYWNVWAWLELPLHRSLNE